MKINRNATPSSFGWDFQINAAIVLTMENIIDVKSIRVEGEKEDIEILLKNGKKIYAQAKSVVSFDDYRNVRKNLVKGLQTLNDAAIDDDYNKLIYVTNSPNPFNNAKSMSAFYGHSRLYYKDLPKVCKEIVDREIEKNILTYINKDELQIHIIPFFTDNPEQRYRVISDSVSRVLFDINQNCSSMTNRLVEIWQSEFFKNSTKSNLNLVINKKDLIWPIIVLHSQIYPKENMLLEEYDDGIIDEIIRSYQYLINNRCEKFEFISQVLYDFQNFDSELKGNKKISEFINIKSDQYKEVFQLDKIRDDFQDIIVKIILQRIINNRFFIDDVVKKVGL